MDLPYNNYKLAQQEHVLLSGCAFVITQLCIAGIPEVRKCLKMKAMTAQGDVRIRPGPEAPAQRL